MAGTKIMIVDDESEFAATLAERLELRGLEVITADCGEQAIANVREGWNPDVVLLDLKMPGLDGLETLELIKNHDPSIEVIILTGHGSVASGINGMKRGVFDYLMKPVDLGELLGKLDQAVKKRRAGQ